MTASTRSGGESSAPVHETGRRAARVWLQSTAATAVAMTVAEAFLLQQKKAFFTGGFLAGTHAGSIGEAAAFLSMSLLVDASVAGILCALLLLAFSRVSLVARARFLLLTAGAALPLIVWDFVSYSLLTHLGDAFDLSLMFDLTGRSPSEVLAVASSHLMLPVALVLSGTAALAGLVWTVDRVDGRSLRRTTSLSWRAAASAVGLFAAGALAFAASTTTSDVIEDGMRRKASGQAFTSLVSSVTDFDRDGYGLGGRTSDPAPFDAAVYPYALDVPANGIDENAIGGDLPAGPQHVERPPASAAWPRRPDVVLFVLESFRADLVGRRVEGRPVTPVLDELARDGAASSRAFSHNGYTTQSRFHLLTGSLAGVIGGTSLIDDFKAQGYETAYFSAQDESFGGPGLDVGFERADVRYDAREDRDRRYSTFSTAGSLAVSHVVLRERLETFLRRRDTGRPLFLYVNFHDAHFPYHHEEIEPLISARTLSQSQIAPSRGEPLRAMYENTAANVDRAVGAALGLVRETAGREPAVIVTADHGESLFDEGFLGHGYALNDAQTRIPLVVRGLPLDIVEPFGQRDLRAALTAALSQTPAGDGRRPRISTDAQKVVFQYLGTIQRPRQIGFVGDTGRVIYDFRDRVVTENGRSGDAGHPGTASLLPLVHFWERLLLAKREMGNGR